jgi:glycosyltransferase involved in cell wall biosynthesis
LSQIHARDQRLKAVRFRRNFGQTPALAAGFDHARGDVIVAMDGDLQYHPEDIPKLLEKIDEGYDIASGWRAQRAETDPLIRRLLSLIANRLMARVSGLQIYDFGSTFKAYRREVIENIRLYGELHRFIPALASQVGATIVEVPVSLSPRTSGKSKYNLSRTFTVMLDLIGIKFLLSYARRPLKIFGSLGLLANAAGFLSLLVALAMKVAQGIGLVRNPLLLLAVLFVLVGVQLTSLGLIGEMIRRVYHAAQGKPIYVVREIVE